MRNGNMEFSGMSLDLISSYRTYEEWKLDFHGKIVNNTMFLPYLWGMETTRFCRSTSRYLRSYRTYEEWKPWRHESAKTTNKFLPYLWGMETGSFSVDSNGDGLFLPYLWGMETRNASVRHSSTIAFLPYLWGMETLLYFQGFSLDLFVFLPYLWGMETVAIDLPAKQDDTVLTVPMRNGNLRIYKSTNICDYYVLTVPMRNGNFF